MAILVTLLTVVVAVILVLLCLIGDYPWEWLVMNPFTGALGGYVGMALRHWIQETRPGCDARDARTSGNNEIRK